MTYCIYLRKSRADKDFDTATVEETLARHESTLLELAKRKNISVTAVYREVVSGENIVSRPEMQRLLREVEQGLWEGVLVMEIERLARGNTKDQGIVAEAFQFSNTKIITPAKTYDPNNEFDEEYFEFGLFMSRREYKTINRRIQRGRIASAKEGKFLGSQPPFGYNKVKLQGEKGYTLEPNENAEIVKLIFELYTNGKKIGTNVYKPMGLLLIAKELDNLGIKPLTSSHWNSSSIKTIITNPVYIGKIRWSWDKEIKIIENGVIRKARQRNDEYILVEGRHPAIVNEKMFNTAQNILTSKKIYPIVSNKELKNPLTGVIFCGKCGSMLTRRNSNCRKGKSKFHLACSNRYCNNISTEISIVENGVVQAAKQWFVEYSTNWEEENRKENSNQINAKQVALNKLKDELKTITSQINSTYDLLEQGVYNIEKFTERNELLSAKSVDIKNKIKTLDSEIIRDLKNTDISANYIPALQHFVDVYLTVDDVKEKNKMLKNLFEKIEYQKNERAKKGKAEETKFNIKLFPKLPK